MVHFFSCRVDHVRSVTHKNRFSVVLFVRMSVCVAHFILFYILFGAANEIFAVNKGPSYYVIVLQEFGYHTK